MKLREGENKAVELHVCFYGYAESKILNCWHFSKNGEGRDVSKTDLLTESTFSMMGVRTRPQAEFSQG